MRTVDIYGLDAVRAEVARVVERGGVPLHHTIRAALDAMRRDARRAAAERERHKEVREGSEDRTTAAAKGMQYLAEMAALALRDGAP